MPDNPSRDVNFPRLMMAGLLEVFAVCRYLRIRMLEGWNIVWVVLEVEAEVVVRDKDGYSDDSRDVKEQVKDEFRWEEMRLGGRS